MHVKITVFGKGFVITSYYFVVETGKNNGVNRERDYPQLFPNFVQHLYIKIRFWIPVFFSVPRDLVTYDLPLSIYTPCPPCHS